MLKYTNPKKGKKLKKLPIENEILKQITIFGNAKDGELTIETTERTFLLALADHTIHINTDKGLSSQISAYDDSNLTITYTPTEELKISSFELNDIDNEESWNDTIESFHNKAKEISGYCWQEIKIDLI
jgi:hypothetical protein